MGKQGLRDSCYEGERATNIDKYDWRLWAGFFDLSTRLG
jgi:hypothetical protein